MEQTPMLFDGTVRENLLLNLEDCEEERMIDACSRAKFLEDMSLLPGQADFEVGHRGKVCGCFDCAARRVCGTGSADESHLCCESNLVVEVPV